MHKTKIFKTAPLYTIIVATNDVEFIREALIEVLMLVSLGLKGGFA